MIKRTLIILKPDAVQRGLVGEIISRFEKKNLKIVKMVFGQASTENLEKHYSEHKGKNFYPKLLNFMRSGPSIFIILEGEDSVKVVKRLVGSTFDALPGSIRGDYAEGGERNIIHASDSVESAEQEINIFFGKEWAS